MGENEIIYRDRPCARCEEKELRRRLDREWDEFVKRNATKVTAPEMLFYMKEREKLFEDKNTHHWDWDQMHSILLEKCKQDIEVKYGTNGVVGQETEASTSGSSARKQHPTCTRNHRDQ
ncbi:hypothetical protein Hte_006451 [Hypoxylon texense]